ncbi:MAG: hypothetical protein A2815_01070 [Candidatus Portnoybacteria bacterium RIFCSPHIGHO2_01_FULL_40_12b]|uniref:Succinylglutamate desuccinylase/Aspartoacylase catalytic domain-containing protein n=1 Tax=Candidatus Portnoybacteria bacterium RIFCSPHIGHO2_01_FULL_40_12b TaxID=1801994 RepID=A0A1G2FBH3_9BACT|nr:MAG: hypothetical protein A2815_01070 [Candidatus Portnoybacteria bacterium RIFCSPHIGHO2_01_FULL_40_12b]
MLNPEYTTGQLKNILSEENLNHERPFVLAELGRGSPVIAVTTATHGDEELGVKIISDLGKTLHLQRGTLRLIVANPPALMRGVRFITEDLNRGYPGISGKQGEAGIAAHVLELVKDSDFTIDIHTTSAPTEGFVIANERNGKKIEFAEMAGINKILLIPRQKKYAMIDFVNCGIGIELGLHNSQYAYDLGMVAIKNVLGKLGVAGEQISEEDRHEYYKLFGSIVRPSSPIEVLSTCHNFQLIHKGEAIAQVDREDFIKAEEDSYPVFLGEKAYATICLKAKKISREEIGGLSTV